MNRRIILYAGLALLVGLYLWDRVNRTDVIMPATVLTIDDQDNEAGPDSWHVTVQAGGSDVALAPLEKRPDLAPGDRTCVTQITRPGDAVEYRWTPSADC